MQWNEVSRKTFGIIVVLVMLFAGTILAAAVLLARRQGGETIAYIVRDSINSERITGAGDGRKIVADALLVAFRAAAPPDARTQLARRVGAKLGGQLAGVPDTFAFTFPQALTLLELRGLVEKIEQDADVFKAEFVYVE